MRLLILIFMIALLPLRGWAGGAMALEMATSHLVATNNIATPADYTGAGGHFLKNSSPLHTECPGHVDATTDTPAAASVASGNNGDDPCKSCGACQMCHTVALSTHVSTAPDATPHHLQRPLGSPFFASAPAALGLKPPIS